MNNVLKIYNQGKKPYCNAYAVANAYNTLLGTKLFIPDRLFKLAKRDNKGRDVLTTPGMLKYLKRGQYIKNYGSIDGVGYRNKYWNEYTQLYRNNPAKMVRVLQDALDKHKLLIVGIDSAYLIDDQLCGGDIRTSRKNQTGHQVIFTGYDDKYFYFANSWGKEFGNKGIGKMRYNKSKTYLDFIQKLLSVY